MWTSTMSVRTVSCRAVCAAALVGKPALLVCRRRPLLSRPYSKTHCQDPWQRCWAKEPSARLRDRPGCGVATRIRASTPHLDEFEDRRAGDANQFAEPQHWGGPLPKRGSARKQRSCRFQASRRRWARRRPAAPAVRPRPSSEGWPRSSELLRRYASVRRYFRGRTIGRIGSNGNPFRDAGLATDSLPAAWPNQGVKRSTTSERIKSSRSSADEDPRREPASAPDITPPGSRVALAIRSKARRQRVDPDKLSG